MYRPQCFFGWNATNPILSQGLKMSKKAAKKHAMYFKKIFFFVGVRAWIPEKLKSHFIQEIWWPIRETRGLGCICECPG